MILRIMVAEPIFLEYRSEFHDLFVDVEDEIAALGEQLEPGFAVAIPGPDVITLLRTCFSECDYDHGPVRPVSLIAAICREPAMRELLSAAGASLTDVTAQLDGLEEASGIVFRGWLPQLVRRYWHRGRWTRETAQLLAHAALGAGQWNRSAFGCAEILMSVWGVEPLVGAALERAHVRPERLMDVMTKPQTADGTLPDVRD